MTERTWPLPTYIEEPMKARRQLYDAFGPCCNACAYWEADVKASPCLDCGVDCEFFELHPELNKMGPQL